MDYNLIKQIEQINLASERLNIFTMQKIYTYNLRNRTFDTSIECTFLSNLTVITNKLSFPSEQAFANAISYIEANPEYKIEDLKGFAK